MFKEALTVLTGIIATDDQEVEAWYLEGWCFMLMGEDAKEQNKEVEGLSWKELAQDARDCLDTCVSVSIISCDKFCGIDIASVLILFYSYSKAKITLIGRCTLIPKSLLCS